MKLRYSIQHVNETTISIKFASETLTPEDIKQLSPILGCTRSALLEALPCIYDCVLAYDSIQIYYDFSKIDAKELDLALESILNSVTASSTPKIQQKCIEIPVYYHHDTGPDLERLATEKQLSVTELISLHTKEEYCVCAIGFAPGFPYLGFVDERLAAPRLNTPRPYVAEGSVGIADRQTGIYPLASPGGWNILGRTPTSMLDQDKCIMEVGNRVRFHAISREQFLSLGGVL